MTPEEFQKLLDTMKVMYRVRKAFDTDLDFAIAIVSVIYLVNDHKEMTEADFMDSMIQTHARIDSLS